MRKAIFLHVLLVSAVTAFPQALKSSAAQAEELFMRNLPQEAAILLEKALNEDPRNERLYEYLGICYQQLGRFDDAILIMKRGLNVSMTNTEVLYLNMGNNYFIQNKYSFAEEMYSNAISRNMNFAPVYLNRALVRIKLGKNSDAISDYTLYLSLDPDSSQKGKILAHIEALKGVLNAEQRKKEEQAQMQKELEAREKALLSEVLNSLKNASEGTLNLSAGSEGLQEYEEELNIED